jgi:hypothetical protein
MPSHTNLTRRRFLKTIGLGAAALSIPGIRAFGGDRGKPNILFIFADDQCFETLRSMGCARWAVMRYILPTSTGLSATV